MNLFVTFALWTNTIHLWVFYEHQHMKSGTNQCHMTHCHIQSFSHILVYCKYKIEVEDCLSHLFHFHYQFCPSSKELFYILLIILDVFHNMDALVCVHTQVTNFNTKQVINVYFQLQLGVVLVSCLDISIIV